MSKFSNLVSCAIIASVLGACDVSDISEWAGEQKAAEQKAEQKRLKRAGNTQRSQEQEDLAAGNIITGFATLILASASSKRSGTTSTPSAPADSFSSRQSSMGNTYNKTQYRFPGGTPASPGAAVPASGQATYTGDASLKRNWPDPAFAIGKMQLTADFSQNTISGRIDNFLNPSDQSVPGSILLSNGVITNIDQGVAQNQNRDDSIDANLAGDIDLDGVNTAVSGTLSGNFREGQVPEPISPSGPGYITGNIYLTTPTTVPLYGNFTVTRQ
jgi:hypothetical protein